MMARPNRVMPERSSPSRLTSRLGDCWIDIEAELTNGPKDVTSESIDLSGRVRMWRRTSLMPLSRPERDEDYAKSRGDPFGRSDS